MPAFQLRFYLLPTAEPTAAPGKKQGETGHWEQEIKQVHRDQTAISWQGPCS